MAASPRSPTTASSAASATAWSPASTSSTAASTTSNSPISAARRARCCRRSIDRSKNTSALCRGQLLLPAERRRRLPARNFSTPRATGRIASSSNGDQSRRDARSACGQPEGRSALEYRSDLAGLRQHLAERRGAELRRKRRIGPGIPIIPFTSIQPADRDHL